jgi:hypothetical protein
VPVAKYSQQSFFAGTKFAFATLAYLLQVIYQYTCLKNKYINCELELSANDLVWKILITHGNYYLITK